MVHVSPFASFRLVLIEVVDFHTPHKNDSEEYLHFCEGERSSSLSTKFEPLSAGSYPVVFDHDRELISSFHDKSLEIEDSWAMEICVAPIMECIVEDVIDKLGSYILDIPYEPCSHNPFLESAMPSAPSTHKGYNHLLVLYCKMVTRLIVDAMSTISISDFVCVLWH
jgi:hypothetical protein